VCRGVLWDRRCVSRCVVGQAVCVEVCCGTGGMCRGVFRRVYCDIYWLSREILMRLMKGQTAHTSCRCLATVPPVHFTTRPTNFPAVRFMNPLATECTSLSVFFLELQCTLHTLHSSLFTMLSRTSQQFLLFSTEHNGLYKPLCKKCISHITV
jgi:hypothetical protein